MTDPVEHQREDDPNNLVRLHRRETDTGVRGWIRRNLSWMAYIILALAIAYSLNDVRSEASQRRTEIVQATQKVIYDSCVRGNDTRALLRSLITDGQSQLKLYLKDGVLTQEQYDRAIAANKAAATKLSDVDCKAAVSTVADAQGTG